MLDWQEIKTVLLDMDGTILDLHFDNHFWLEHLPKRYSETANISLNSAKNELSHYYHEVAGTIQWYCLDYWAEKTKLPITELKKEVEHLISLRADAIDFLLALKAAGKEIVLVTNAHPDSLSLKIEKTQLDQYFDALYSTHQFGITKEFQLLWQKLQQHHGFELNRTLFVDDSLPILQSAQTFGFKHLLAVANPDSKKAINTIDGFDSITDFRSLIPAIQTANL
jgi:putative hydrolase of the HAD superfamily